MKLKKENYEELANDILKVAFAPSTSQGSDTLVLDYEYSNGELEIKHKVCFNFNGHDVSDDFDKAKLQTVLNEKEGR